MPDWRKWFQSGDSASAETRLGIGSISTPPLFRFIAPSGENLIWSMLIGAHRRGHPMLLSYTGWSYFKQCAVFFVIGFAFGVFGKKLTPTVFYVLPAFHVLSIFAPIYGFNDQLKKYQIVAELRLTPIENPVYVDAFWRFFVLGLVLTVPPLICYWLGMATAGFPVIIAGNHLLLPLAVILAAAAIWLTCWIRLYNGMQRVIAAFIAMVYSVVLLLLLQIPSSLQANVQRLLPLFMLFGTALCAALGCWLMLLCRSYYTQRVLPKLHQPKAHEES